jgi:glycosyltransferase involved in cell wall biosynthesis
MVSPISVVLPVYNQENYVAQTIESVLSQTFADFELLVHDDGSTDGSAAIIRRYAAQYARIRASFAPNAGKCEATNRLVEQAQGQWCAFLDADNVMLPERLEKQVAFHRAHPDVDTTSYYFQYINEYGQHLSNQRHPGLRT